MKKNKKNRPIPLISQETTSRRSVLNWLGKATVLTLGADLIAACTPSRTSSHAGSDIGFDLATDTENETVSTSGDAAVTDLEDFSFAPGTGEHDVYDDWRVRTVDPQDLENILANWTLVVDGLVANPVELSFVDVVELLRQDQLMDFHCVEGWSVYDVPWNGVHLSTLFDLVEPLETATHVTFHTVEDQYNESLPLEVAVEPHTILAYGVGGSTLPLSHGFPARMVIPRLLGYKSAKYVYRIELTDAPVEGYWVAVGYPYDGEVPEQRLREGRY